MHPKTGGGARTVNTAYELGSPFYRLSVTALGFSVSMGDSFKLQVSHCHRESKSV